MLVYHMAVAATILESAAYIDMEILYTHIYIYVFSVNQVR